MIPALSWLLRVSALAEDHVDTEYLGLPPISTNEPILGLIWEQVASTPAPSTAAPMQLRDNDRYDKLIIEESSVRPLVKLIKEGKKEGQ